MKREPQSVQTRIDEEVAPGTRVDSYIADTLKLFTRAQARRRVVRLLLNGRPVKLSKRVQPGDLLEVEYAEAPATEVVAEAIPLEILFEDPNVVVINKPQGMVVHPASGNWSGTLVNALLHYCDRLAQMFPGEEGRPGIVHRLDKETSGLIITAKNAESRDFLARQFRDRRVGKQYIAIVKGDLPAPEGRIETRIGRDPRHRKRFTCLKSPEGGKKAVTLYRQLRERSGYTLASLQPKTGRTHQLRVHMAHLGCPIVGDSLYGGLSAAPLMLHAYGLKILLPGDAQPRIFRAPLPSRFSEFWRTLPES